MSKKYVIEMKSEYEDTIRGIMVLGARDSNLYMDALAVEDMEELTSDYINEHFGDLQDTAYQKGFEDGKAVYKKSCEGCEYEEVMGLKCRCCSNRYPNQWTAKQTDDEIKVGDEVVNNTTGTKGILLEPETQHLLARVIVPNDRWSTFNIRHANLTKTGKHYDIEKFLEAMKA